MYKNCRFIITVVSVQGIQQTLEDRQTEAAFTGYKDKDWDKCRFRTQKDALIISLNAKCKFDTLNRPKQRAFEGNVVC